MPHNDARRFAGHDFDEQDLESSEHAANYSGLLGRCHKCGFKRGHGVVPEVLAKSLHAAVQRDAAVAQQVDGHAWQQHQNERAERISAGKQPARCLGAAPHGDSVKLATTRSQRRSEPGPR